MQSWKHGAGGGRAVAVEVSNVPIGGSGGGRAVKKDLFIIVVLISCDEVSFLSVLWINIINARIRTIIIIREVMITKTDLDAFLPILFSFIL